MITVTKRPASGKTPPKPAERCSNLNENVIKLYNKLNLDPITGML